MRKVLLACAVFALLLLWVGCGNDSHTTTPIQPAETQMFAFIRTSGGTGTTASAGIRQMNRARIRHNLRKLHTGVGLRPMAVEIAPGTDSVVLMKNDGSGESVIANQAGTFYNVQLSYDGKKGVATAEDLNGWLQVYYVDLSNTANPILTQLTADAEDHWEAQLSRDGSKVAFDKYVDTAGKYQLVIMATTPGTENVISTPTIDVAYPSFAPDGKIVFMEWENATINIMNADGTGNKALTQVDPTLEDYMPSVSPDGKTIVFERWNKTTGNDEIYSMGIDGANLKALTTDGHNWDPMFVNDKIVFLSYRDSVDTWIGNEVYSMSLDGSNQKRLTNNTVDEYFLYD